MLLWQQPENSVTPSFDTSFDQSPHEEVLVGAYGTVPDVPEAFLFRGDGITAQRNDGTALCSILEEQLLMPTMPNYMCADNYWHDHGLAHVGNGNAEDECSFALWDNLLELTSQCQTLNHDASSVCTAISSAPIPTNTNTPFGQSSPVYWEASSVASYQHDPHAPFVNNCLNEHPNITPHIHSDSTNSRQTSFLPGFFSGETSGTCLANTSVSFHSSPVYSEASSFAMANQHDSFYMRNHSNDHLDMHRSMHQDATNSVHASNWPNFGPGSAHMMNSGSTASNMASSDDDFFDSEASSFATFGSPPPHDLKSAIVGALNLVVRASQPQLNLEARASPLYEASSYSMNITGATRSSNECEAPNNGESVSFLVENSTPPIDDGFVWRKYGQKRIKDKLHPRSYFKCAQSNCPVKKQTESSSDEQGFMLITYFGRHNHSNNLHVRDDLLRT